MRSLVLGAAGFIGSNLTTALLARSSAETDQPADDEFVFSDLRRPADPWLAPRATPNTQFIAGDLLDPTFLQTLFERPFDRIFHLAAALTLDAEMDFERGMQLNVQALIRLLDACRAQANAPRLLFASSISSFGGTLPAVVDDDTHQTPQTSYGVHKVIAEQLINDYSRRGFIDGRVLRLPIVLTHPGPPSASVSDRVAALIREPLQGGSATCPLASDAPLAVASVERVVAAFLQLAELPASVFGATRAMNLPALTATPAQIVEAVRRRNPALPDDCIRWQPDPVLQCVVDGWPSVFTSQLATELGITGDASVDDLVAAFQPTQVE